MSDNPFLITQGAAETRPFLMGTVTSTTGGLFGEIEKIPRTVSLKRLASYTPTIGHRVLVAKISGTYVVLGRVV